MKRLGGIWQSIISFENLLAAFRKARKGKGSLSDVALFSLELETRLLELQRELQSGQYRPGKYRLFTIYERKPRLIAAAPFRDRIVHHALMNILEPKLDSGFIYDTYACRKGKGVHAAVERYQRWAKRYSYVLKMDITRYFPNVDHLILFQKLNRKIKDAKTLSLLQLIIDTSPPSPEPPEWFLGDDIFTPLERKKGIPIGNLTSQFFANFYLNELDHFIKEQCGIKAYLRYVDDLLVLHDDKRYLKEIQNQIREKLEEHRLRLHPRKAHIMPVRNGVDVLGYRVYPDFRLLRNDNGHRFSRKLRRMAFDFKKGHKQWEEVNASVQSWIGHARHADTLGLRKTLFDSVIFSRGPGR